MTKGALPRYMVALRHRCNAMRRLVSADTSDGSMARIGAGIPSARVVGGTR
jgi:hypothetical protein